MAEVVGTRSQEAVEGFDFMVGSQGTMCVTMLVTVLVVVIIGGVPSARDAYSCCQNSLWDGVFLLWKVSGAAEITHCL